MHALFHIKEHTPDYDFKTRIIINNHIMLKHLTCRRPPLPLQNTRQGTLFPRYRDSTKIPHQAGEEIYYYNYMLK